MSYLKIWIHCVWTTNKRLPYLKDEIRNEIIYHYAVSLGMSQLENLRSYIRNQEQHHQKFKFEDELNSLIEEYQLQKILD